ncbi:MAG: DUF4388 domain-containing protein [Chloroflexi bacterium]|uniref:DUF4388 domain-containing protein n=1 Tax=Candidatus Chlorohelix allophototropha TaxID=3003348 RepID=A0A8T7LX40_9CHLR|nr:DUF4388 domain-containing protein [Chloroflexota bacterium]WJW67406.1 DUF4388 domain-containing protein [Chloroflexota bacterium L227-S17]
MKLEHSTLSTLLIECEQQGSSGLLHCQNTTKHYTLSLKEGKLVHAEAEDNAATNEAFILSDLLRWQNGEIWFETSEIVNPHTITDSQEKIFRMALSLLQKGENESDTCRQIQSKLAGGTKSLREKKPSVEVQIPEISAAVEKQSSAYTETPLAIEEEIMQAEPELVEFENVSFALNQTEVTEIEHTLAEASATTELSELIFELDRMETAESHSLVEQPEFILGQSLQAEASDHSEETEYEFKLDQILAESTEQISEQLSINPESAVEAESLSEDHPEFDLDSKPAEQPNTSNEIDYPEFSLDNEHFATVATNSAEEQPEFSLGYDSQAALEESYTEFKLSHDTPTPETPDEFNLGHQYSAPNDGMEKFQTEFIQASQLEGNEAGILSLEDPQNYAIASDALLYDSSEPLPEFSLMQTENAANEMDEPEFTLGPQIPEGMIAIFGIEAVHTNSVRSSEIQETFENQDSFVQVENEAANPPAQEARTEPDSYLPVYQEARAERVVTARDNFTLSQECLPPSTLTNWEQDGLNIISQHAPSPDISWIIKRATQVKLEGYLEVNGRNLNSAYFSRLFFQDGNITFQSFDDGNQQYFGEAALQRLYCAPLPDLSDIKIGRCAPGILDAYLTTRIPAPSSLRGLQCQSDNIMERMLRLVKNHFTGSIVFYNSTGLVYYLMHEGHGFGGYQQQENMMTRVKQTMNRFVEAPDTKYDIHPAIPKKLLEDWMFIES